MGPLEEPGQLAAQPRGAGHTGEEKGNFGDVKETTSTSRARQPPGAAADGLVPCPY